MTQTLPSAVEASEEELAAHANTEAELRLAELDDQEDPCPDPPAGAVRGAGSFSRAACAGRPHACAAEMGHRPRR